MSAQTSNSRGLYAAVGRGIFAVDTQRMANNRVRSATAKQEAKVQVARAQANGPQIVDHSMAAYEGMQYAYPKNFYCPLRSTQMDSS